MSNTFSKYVVLCIALFLSTEFLKYILKFEVLIYNSLSEHLTSRQIENFFEMQNQWKWVGYVFTPVFILLKTILVASVLYIGTFFYSKVKVTFKQLWDVVLKAEFLFLLVGVCKIIWFYFFQTTYTLEDLQYFYPLSALNIIGYKGLEPWFIYPLQTLNVFEVVYWFILAYYISRLASPTKNVSDYKPDLDFGLKIVLASYGSALLLWVVVVMFFTLNYS
jgi:hypothetical protein